MGDEFCFIMGYQDWEAIRDQVAILGTIDKEMPLEGVIVKDEGYHVRVCIVCMNIKYPIPKSQSIKYLSCNSLHKLFV